MFFNYFSSSVRITKASVTEIPGACDVLCKMRLLLWVMGLRGIRDVIQDGPRMKSDLSAIYSAYHRPPPKNYIIII